jgi:hypothetical protein
MAFILCWFVGAGTHKAYAVDDNAVCYVKCENLNKSPQYKRSNASALMATGQHITIKGE